MKSYWEAAYPVVFGLGCMTLLASITFRLLGAANLLDAAFLPYAALGALLGTIHGILWARSWGHIPTLKTWVLTSLSIGIGAFLIGGTANAISTSGQISAATITGAVHVALCALTTSLLWLCFQHAHAHQQVQKIQAVAAEPQEMVQRMSRRK